MDPTRPIQAFEQIGHKTTSSDASYECVEDALVTDLKAYQEFLLPPALCVHPFFDLENAENWVLKIKREPVSINGNMTSGTGNKQDSFVLDFDSSSSPSRAPSAGISKRKRCLSSHASSDSVYSSSEIILLSTPVSKRTKKESDQTSSVKVTRKTRVGLIILVKGVPQAWAVPKDGSAYLLDLTDSPEVLEVPDGKPKSMDSLIRAMDEDSWGGSSSRTEGNCTVAAGIFGDESIRVRKATLHCNGLNVCECLDSVLLNGIQRYEPDEEAKLALWEHEREYRNKESNDPLRCLVRLYNIIMSTACRKPDCKGLPIMKTRSQGVSPEGKLSFIGCELWSLKEQYEHRYVTIPQEIDEDELRLVMETGCLSGNLTLGERCSFTQHPRFGLRKHCLMLRMGRLSVHPWFNTNVTQNFKYLCRLNRRSVKLSSYFKSPIVIQPTVSKTHFVPTGTPPTTQRSRRSGPASSTKHLLNGQAFEDALSGYVDDRRLRDTLRKLNRVKYPNGMDWEVIRGGVRIAVTMFYDIVKNIHTVPYIAIDFTFKPVRGETNRWDVAAFLEEIDRS
ncbi:hypothetical protein M422DRAFT_56824 [Sphaerobolus stellatus SS14]|uniref:Uncharacterized protein n=1 Tax=Sphaerobolus stellatus (strain SS14) TaxID=990650 RepID=A0A0C9UDH9_SPHS4|nr:hypothetical protein M422DRAFT_56824 [Sphaerobolus stellatus SS14]